MDKRKRYTPEEKIKILREILEDGKSISQTAEKPKNSQMEASANHPQSNGKLERFNRTLKTEHVRRARTKVRHIKIMMTPV